MAALDVARPLPDGEAGTSRAPLRFTRGGIVNSPGQDRRGLADDGQRLGDVGAAHMLHEDLGLKPRHASAPESGNRFLNQYEVYLVRSQSH
jgi:hypothetical protein